MPKIPVYQSRTVSGGGRAQVSASPADFGADIAAQLKVAGQVIGKYAEEQEQAQYFKEKADAIIASKQAMTELESQVIWDAKSGTWKKNENGKISDLGSDYSTAYQAKFNEIWNPLRQKYKGKFDQDIDSQRVNFVADTFDSQASIKASGEVTYFDDTRNKYTAMVERGEISAATASETINNIAMTLPSVPATVKNKLVDENQNYIGEAEFKGVFARDPMAAIDQLESGHYDNLDPNYREKFSNEIDRYAVTVAQRESSRLSDAMTFGTNYGVSSDTINLLRKTGNHDVADELLNKQALHNYGMGALNMPLTEVQDNLNTALQNAYISGDANAVRKAEYAQNLVAKKVQTISTDPMLWAARTGQVSTIEKFDINNPAAAIEQRRAVRTAISKKEGIPLNTIPLIGKSDATEFVNTVAQIPVDQRSVYFGQFASLIGEEEVGTVAAEISKLSPNAGVALTTARYDPEVTAMLLNSENLAEAPAPSQDKIDQKFYTTFGNTELGGAYNTTKAAVTAVYNTMAYQKGISNKEVDETTWNDAVKKVTGGPIVIGNSKAVNFRMANGEWAAQGAIDSTINAIRDMPEVLNNQIWVGTGSARVAADIDQMFEYGVAVPVPKMEGVYTFKRGNEYYQGADGKPVKIDIRNFVNKWSVGGLKPQAEPFQFEPM